MKTDCKETPSESKEKFWHQYISKCTNSKLSQKGYYRENGLALSTFHY